MWLGRNTKSGVEEIHISKWAEIQNAIWKKYTYDWAEIQNPVWKKSTYVCPEIQNPVLKKTPCGWAEIQNPVWKKSTCGWAGTDERDLTGRPGSASFSWRASLLLSPTIM